ncbi:MAG: hypothetical protein KJ989_02795 [Gammaproteobacteria bacterium]|jgi:hypothetical protein|uniref:Uncharacterized protein n=1 Tax=Pseudomonas spirodelae TaxID=3101751 RepID=A0ABU5P3K7_9PSED|nr:MULTISPECIES: hypothetical protein [Pseudomonas]MBU1282905.1 hypothetical protein [Gammaproteobacteria bacterium]MBU2254805.1 hypothetical protein [Gammaproteobacteria bacterium]MBU2293115.1 hypothetical protein [Gammaproteobacteria bacterium]MDR7025436.1 hypothetical protein [Pseudomonas peli]MEA1604232.1 hypothetical protein [Pseudomonas sp. T5W1]
MAFTVVVAVAEHLNAPLGSQQTSFETASGFCSSLQQPAMGVSLLVSAVE